MSVCTSKRDSALDSLIALALALVLVLMSRVGGVRVHWHYLLKSHCHWQSVEMGEIGVFLVLVLMC